MGFRLVVWVTDSASVAFLGVPVLLQSALGNPPPPHAPAGFTYNSRAYSLDVVGEITSKSLMFYIRNVNSIVLDLQHELLSSLSLDVETWSVTEITKYQNFLI